MAYLLKPRGTTGRGGNTSTTSHAAEGGPSPNSSATSSSLPTNVSPRTFLQSMTSFMGSTGTKPERKAPPTNAVDKAKLDSALYQYAVDFEEVDRILRDPLPQSTYYRPPPGSTANSDLSLSYRKLASDPEGGVELFSAPVEQCPIHMMRAVAIMPCASEDVLSYMDGERRVKWDTLIEQSRVIRELHPDRDGEERSSELRTARQPPPPSAGAVPFSFQRGQRRVALHYLGVRSPVAFVQRRDLEMVVAEEVRQDGTAYMKAFSAPLGYAMPLDPEQSRYVRAVLFLSAVVARPVQPSATDATVLVDGRPIPPRLRGARSLCAVEYLGLLHPMGMIPPVIVNMVITAQVDTLRRLQLHMLSEEGKKAQRKASSTSDQTKDHASEKDDMLTDATQHADTTDSPKPKRVNAVTSFLTRSRQLLNGSHL
ncbi:hypothetical protein ADEAN_000734800 [Angomonas deanei]|uniref:START domain-containing protein n=1 Tax=Angomonas deanei TaxID=59799 RepID=A0A7G2CKC5_9TRYP|nr:hypothetical protein ADEAN_000734800 [Angomonas deanei]